MKMLIWVILLGVMVAAVCTMGMGPIRPEGKSPVVTPFIFDNDTRIDANLIHMFVTNHGSFAWDITTGNAGLEYPRGSGMFAVFASGLWIGAMVNSQLRVTVAEYSTEYQPGCMVMGGPNPNYDRLHFRVYKIDGNSGPGDPDWDEWPRGEGAPVNEFGEPLLIGEQTLWCVYNDAEPTEHTNNAGGTLPLGVEVQQTAFAFTQENGLDVTVFMKFLIINNGINSLDSTYIAIWSDPDLGGAGDDFVGCDTTRWVGYCYNATNNDPVYGSQPPCVGYDFLQGPIVPSLGDTARVSGIPYPNFRNLPLTSFNKYINGTDPGSPQESYWYMLGLDAVAGGGSPYIDPYTGDTTTYVMAGDPVTGTGWCDSNPSDRRFMLSSGPFDLEPTSQHGDSVIFGVTAQEAWLAIVMGQGADRLASIIEMRTNDDEVQEFFDNMFLAVEPAPQTNIPGEFSLHQNYPNPFNSSTSIAFDLKNPSNITLKIYDVLGQEVVTVIDSRYDAGKYTVSWNAAGMPSGIYFCQLQTGDFTEIRKLLLLK
jgi:hypothetical protein